MRYGEAAGVRITVRNQAVLKNKHRQIFIYMIEEDVEQQVGLGEGLRKSALKISLCNGPFQTVKAVVQNMLAAQ